MAQIDDLGASTAPEAEADARFLGNLVRCLGSERLELPVFPDVSLRLDRLLRQPSPSLSEVTELVSSDPDLLRRVWSASQSAMFARGVSNLDHAIARIGFDALWRIGMTACVHAPVFRAGPYQRRVEQLRARGMVAGKVAAWMGDDSRGDAFLAGMLHGAGGLYVWRNAAQGGRAHPSMGRIRRVLREHSCSFGVLMARAWGFGDRVAAGVGYWPQPERVASEHEPFVRTVHRAVVATMSVEEGRAGRDCGGLDALDRYEDAQFSARATLARAERCWRGEKGPESADGDAQATQSA
jgi:HD-like signal output (HDOD) protein